MQIECRENRCADIICSKSDTREVCAKRMQIITPEFDSSSSPNLHCVGLSAGAKIYSTSTILYLGLPS